ncbi:MAG TPA: acetoin utilization protein AcuC [Thermoanaerobaculaceae bacterium]|nr:acetoin utilization protein AcuC [Thermoanaerobaculaceae bacterium]
MAALIFSPSYRAYDFGSEHPFSPVRVEMAFDLLAALGHHLSWEEPVPATREDILTVHSETYVRAVEALSTGQKVADPEALGLGTPDTPAFPGMDLAARTLVGGTLAGARLLSERRATRVLNFGGGLHHAQPARASGFCVYNDLAVAIRHLTSSGLWVSYLDIDVHHGDGVQAVFYADDKVQTISLHESGQYLFPGTGGIHELGEGMGRGLKINVPLEPFTEGESYLEIFEKIVPRALEAFGPHVLVVQAGADAHFDDPLADLALTTRTYERLFHRIVELADSLTEGRILFTLGGGYSPHAASRVWAILYLVVNDLPVPDAIPEVWSKRWASCLSGRNVATLHDADPAYPPQPHKDEISRRNRLVATRLLDALMPFWF